MATTILQMIQRFASKEYTVLQYAKGFQVLGALDRHSSWLLRLALMAGLDRTIKRLWLFV